MRLTEYHTRVTARGNRYSVQDESEVAPEINDVWYGKLTNELQDIVKYEVDVDFIHINTETEVRQIIKEEIYYPLRNQAKQNLLT